MTAINTNPEKKLRTENTKAAAIPYTGLSGLSEHTGSSLGKYAAGYTPSPAVTQARDYLNGVVSGKPAGYRSSYQQQLDNLYSQVMSRPGFSYDPSGDSLFQQYKNQYMNMGLQAMMDTTAQASALTGGYGNSYAATAGNQAYQAYLNQINSALPEFYQMAADRYEAEGQALADQYEITAGLESADYERYRDGVSDWQNQRDYAAGEYWNQYNADYSDYSAMLDFWNGLAKAENSQYLSEKDDAYKQSMSILKTGKLPSSALLDKSGITKSDAKKLANYYGRKSSGSGSKSSGKTGSSTAAKTVQLSDYANSLYEFLSTGTGKNAAASEKASVLSGYVEKGKITSSEAKAIRTKLGIGS